MKLSPTRLDQRIESIDALRGIALLGIFIANMLLFHTPYLYIDPYTWFEGLGEFEAFRFIDIFIEASFYPIFALLFGYGINIQYEKAKTNQSPFAPIASRRMGLLAVFGLIHGILIWSGDILLPYAVMGIVMIGLVRIPAKWLMTTAIAYYTIVMGGFILLIRLILKLDPTAIMQEFADIHKIELSISAYSQGSIAEIVSFRFGEWLVVGIANGVFMGFILILPLMMIGAALSKWKVFQRVSELKARYIIFAVLFLVMGIVIKSLPYLINSSYDLLLFQDTFGGVFLGIGYITIFMLLYEVKVIQKLARPFSTVGKMAFTTYIMQSVIATIIFYSYGFGLYGKVDVVTGTLIALSVFAIQVIFAELWLMKFRMGPLEWIWRRGTYGKNTKSIRK